ncbi:unnamed protein product [Rotaria socialis]|uniref:Uncharacterized protein n=1 Tax=Rotaria socialis TaxID=392032 RepID=A0A817P4Y6_9BILA|nr:unnamed protein product [Rotaria socialis]CAF3325769.1 unnamed protein product [Rotaria socialis]
MKVILVIELLNSLGITGTQLFWLFNTNFGNGIIWIETFVDIVLIMSVAIIPIGISLIPTTNKSQFFSNKQSRLTNDDKQRIAHICFFIISLLFTIGILFETGYSAWKKYDIKAAAIVAVFGLVLCGILVSLLVFQLPFLVGMYREQHQHYCIQQPIKHDKSSRYIKIEWLPKQYIRKLNMVMSRVPIKENRQFNI